MLYHKMICKLLVYSYIYPGYAYKRAVLELKGNVYPAIEQSNPYQYNLLHNILLDAARKEYRMEKYKEIAANLNV